MLLNIFNIVNMINLQLNIKPNVYVLAIIFMIISEKKNGESLGGTAKIGGCSLETVQNIQGILNTYTSINTKKRLTQNRKETVPFIGIMSRKYRLQISQVTT